MNMATHGGGTLDPQTVAQLRREHYNATLAAVIEPHSDLRILRVIPDGGVPPLLPGQFVTLGLGYWEARVAGVDDEHADERHLRRLARRAYSVSCSILDDAGRLARVTEFPYLEIYVALVRHGEKHAPALTPRLFGLKPGDRLFVEPHASGHYTLQGVLPEQDVVFLATGTGEAPHNAMIAELLSRGHRGHIASAVSVRCRRDAAYRAVHEELARRYANYRYLVLTTREPENLDPQRPDYVGKRHLQDLARSGELERKLDVRLDPQRAHVFLCGSPAMIGVGHKTAAGQPLVEPGSMLDLLLARGFTLDGPSAPGNVHFERYW
jgi:ferredoxin--NADP+ reductase